jgi:hypothetical protein
MGFFYDKLKYRGSVDQHKRWKDQPLPKSLGILEKEGMEVVPRYKPPDAHEQEGAHIPEE